MKTMMALILIMIVCSASVTAAPAAPIWRVFAGVNGLNDNYFVSDPSSVNRLFQPRVVNYLTAGAMTSNGTRFIVGYEQKMIMAAIDKQLNENWWVTVGYQSGKSLLSGFNISAAYSIAPNAAVSIGYTSGNVDYELKNAIFRTQLYIQF